MLDRIPQRDTEIIEQLAFSYAESVQEATRNTLATIYKKGVIAERKAVIDEVLGIMDDEIASWERIRDELGYKPEDDNAEAALAIARSRIKEAVEALKGGEK